MKKVITLIVTFVLVFMISMPTFAAEGNVTYSGNAGEFVFQPGSKYSLTDLFSDFKDVMPGDAISQKILIKNNATKNVKISMRSLGAHEGSESFLQQLDLYVEQKEDTPLFSAPADQSAQLTEWRSLGIFAPGAEMELEVVLHIPVTLDNTYKDMVGYIDWEFLAEETDLGPNPSTGDDANYWPYVWGLAGSVAVVVVVILVKRRRDKEETE